MFLDGRRHFMETSASSIDTVIPTGPTAKL